MTIVEIVYAAFQKGIVSEKLDDAKRRAADGDDVHAAVVVFLGYFKNFGGAAGSGHAVIESEEHAEFGFVVKTIADHLAITRLENVQRKVGAGEENDVQRKQRNAIGPHGFVLQDSSRIGE
ncbi:MAG: hypothetical protein NVS9B14_20150 [Candidatus Acidiferrum sp.]